MKDFTTSFAVIAASGTLLADTISGDSITSILRFFSMDGNGKYISMGWKAARADGYHIGIIKSTNLL